jgi:hypothetical protein
LHGLTSRAAAPVLDHVFPAAVQIGTTNTLTFVGKSTAWPPQVWSDAPGMVFKPTTNSGEVNVVVATNAPPGPHWIRAFNADGASAPRILILTRDPQRAEVEPNDDRAAAQSLEQLPTVVNGRLEKTGDVDSFSVQLAAGQTLVAWLEAYSLMSPLDPVLRLLDSRGIQVALNHDRVGSLDPFLTWTALAPGRYVLQAFGFSYPADSDVRFAGSAAGVYRLHVSTGPVLRYTLPLGARRGTNTVLQLAGWNLGTTTRRVPFNPTAGTGPETDVVRFQPEGFDDPVELPVGDGPELLETEPNDVRTSANPLPVPGAVTGDLNRAGDEDRFRFLATQGESLILDVQSARLGFLLDAWLKVEDSTGKELARNDDASGPDPRLEWTPPADGPYFAVVGNLLRNGGTDLWYRLDVRRPKPGLAVTVSENSFSVEPGKTNEIKVTLGRRHGFNVPVRLTAPGLPADVRVDPVEVAGTAGEGILKLVAAGGAKPFSGPFRIVATETVGGREHEAVMSLVSTGENNGVPQGFSRLVLETISKFWFTVLSPPPAPKPAAEKK